LFSPPLSRRTRKERDSRCSQDPRRLFGGQSQNIPSTTTCYWHCNDTLFLYYRFCHNIQVCHSFNGPNIAISFSPVPCATAAQEEFHEQLPGNLITCPPPSTSLPFQEPTHINNGYPKPRFRYLPLISSYHPSAHSLEPPPTIHPWSQNRTQDG
jgi:hypothetical protein